ncbi:thermonuclease family protein [Pseudomonas entomophila]|uniref:thermonuclease family protein n=1 Tax=Pseudomonas sp. RIT-PI-S TaxID=3035295 RepID=UPI0021D86384
MGAFLLSTVYLGSAQAGCPSPPSVALSKVARVIDGDTLRLADGRSVRLIGLNAPELADKGRPSEPYAEAARRRLHALVDEAGGQVAILPGAQPRDRYGRALANVYSPDGRNLEARLLEEGLGYQVVVPPNDALRLCHGAAELTARRAGLGVWRRFSPRPSTAIDRSGFAIVEGRVLKVERNGGGLWLELEGGLALQVAQRDSERFDLALLQGLPGQVVEARGWITDRGRRSARRSARARWVLRLTHPAMLVTVPSEPKVVGSKP